MLQYRYIIIIDVIPADALVASHKDLSRYNIKAVRNILQYAVVKRKETINKND